MTSKRTNSKGSAGGASSTSSSSMATMMTGASEGEGDKVKPIVDQIMTREKENQTSVKKLRNELALEGRRCVQRVLTIQSKQQSLIGLIRENENMEATIKDALQNIKIIAARKKRDRPIVLDENGVPVAGQQVSVEELNNQLKNIKQTLDELAKEKGIVSKTTTPSSAEKRIVDDKNLIDQKDPAKRRQEWQRRKNLVKELKSLGADWVNKVSTFKTGKPGETAPTTFPGGVQHILQYVEAKIASSPHPPKITTPSSGNRDMKSKVVAKDKWKTEKHGAVTRRLNDRKPLENLPSKIRRDYELVSQERPKTAALPEPKTNLVQYLGELFEWGEKEREHQQDQTGKMAVGLKSTKSKAEGDEKMRRKLVADLDAEIKRADQMLEKAKTENRDCLKQANQLTQGVETNNARRKAIIQEIKTLKPTGDATKNPETLSRTESLQKETQAESKKYEDALKAMNDLKLVKLRKEDELKRLEEEIRDQRKPGVSSSSRPPSIHEDYNRGQQGSTEVVIIKYNKD